MDSQKRATVSVCIIAKDEAATIQPSLESIRDQVDEIVVLVDDSTTDGTLSLAKKYADVVSTFHWENDFAKARNLAISRCTKQWVLSMDAHEVLHPKSKQVLSDLLKRVLPGLDLADTQVFSAMIYMNPEGTDIERLIPTTFFLQPRLFLNNGKHKYYGRVHNWLNSDPDSGLKRPVNELVFVHKRTEENSEVRKKQRAVINIPQLLLDVEDIKRDNVPKTDPRYSRPYFYLAQTYYEVDDLDNALKHYKLYLQRSTWFAERAHAYLMLGAIYQQRKDYKSARQAFLDGMKEDWERAEFPLSLGNISWEQKDLYQAEHWWKAATEMKPPMNGMFLVGAAYTYEPYMKLAMLYSTVGEWFEAIQSAQKAISLGCTNQDMIGKIDVWKTKAGMKPNAKNVILYDENNAFTFLGGIQSHLSEKGYNVATSIVFDSDASKWADVIWIEWCAANLMEATAREKPANQKWICRLHGYEIFSSTRMLHTDWSKLDVLMFVAEHIRQRFLEVYWLPDSVKTVVIPNGIDVKRWSFAKREYSDSKNIGIVGILTDKKGPQILAKVIRHFAEKHPEYKFLLRFDIPHQPSVEEGVLRYDLRDLRNWEWVPRQESMNVWMEDLKYLISTSTLESFSYVVGEAMTKGIKPLIHDFMGSRDLWPHELIWRDIEELEKVIAAPYESDKYRQWVIDKYSLDKQIDKIVELIEETK